MMTSAGIPEVESLIALLADPVKLKANLEDLQGALKRNAELEASARSALEAAATAQAKAQELRAGLDAERADFESEKMAFDQECALKNGRLHEALAAAQASKAEFEGKVAQLKLITG